MARRRTVLLLALALSIAPFGVGGAAALGATASATQTELSVATDNFSARTKVTLTARVGPLSGTNVPAGVVTFRSGSLDLGSAVLDSAGYATLTTNNLPPGNHQVVAVYRGDAAYQASLSPSAEADAAQSEVAGFTLSANPTTINIPVGSFASSIITVTPVTVTPVNPFNAYVNLSCTGLPPGATCNFTPTNVLAACTVSGSTVNCPASYSTLQIQTQAPSSALTMPAGPGRGLPVYAILFPAVFGVAGVGARKKRMIWNALLLVLLFAGAMSMTACNVRYYYLNHGPTPNPGTPTGTYTVTVNSVSTQGSLITTPPTSPQLAVTITGN